MRQQSKKYVAEGSKYAHWIGLYLSFHLNWVLDPFFHGRLQNLQTSEVTSAHVIIPLTRLYTLVSHWMPVMHFANIYILGDNTQVQPNLLHSMIWSIWIFDHNF